MEKKQTTRFLKQFYWVMSHVIFVFYMANTYDTYLKTYEKNIFGIDQRQYIVLINYLMFLLVALMIVGAMEGKFRVKNIGKDGIELERVIEETSIEAFKNNSEIVSKIYEELAELDKIVDFLFSVNQLSGEIEETEYLSQVEFLCKSLVSRSNSATIEVYNGSDYDEYLKTNLGLQKSEQKLLHYKFHKYNVIKVENGIHIKYEYAPFHNFLTETNKCYYIVLTLDDIIDINVGQLIYSYLKVFESLESKYILLNAE